MEHSIEVVQAEIKKVCDEVYELLIDKNNSYGNSAINPIRVFCKADPLVQIESRMDDKLSRLKSGRVSGDNEDTIKDLIGYLILYRVATKLHNPDYLIKEVDPFTVKVLRKLNDIPAHLTEFDIDRTLPKGLIIEEATDSKAQLST